VIEAGFPASSNGGAEIVFYSVDAISGSTESQGKVTVRLQNADRVVNDMDADADSVVASAKASLNAFNKLQDATERVAAQGWRNLNFQLKNRLQVIDIASFFRIR